MPSSRTSPTGAIPMLAAVAAVFVLAASIPAAGASSLVAVTQGSESGSLQITRHGRQLGSAGYCPVITFPAGGYTLTPGQTNTQTIATVTAASGTTLSDCHFSGLPEGAKLQGEGLTITYGANGEASGHFTSGCTTVTIVMIWVPTEGKYTLGMKITDNKGASVTGTLTITIGSGYHPVASPPAVTAQPPVSYSPPMTAPPSTTTPGCPILTFPSGGWDMSTYSFSETITITSSSSGAALDSCSISGIPEGATITVKESSCLAFTYNHDGTASGVFTKSCASVTIVFSWTPTEAQIKAGVTITLKITVTDTHSSTVTGTLTCSTGGGGYPAVHSPPPKAAAESPKPLASPPPVTYHSSPSPVTSASPPPYVYPKSSPPPTVASPPPTVASPPPKVASPPPVVASPPPVSSPPPPVSSPPPPVSSPPPPVSSPPPPVSSPPPPKSPSPPPPVVFMPPMCSYPTPGTTTTIEGGSTYSGTVATTSAVAGAVIRTVRITGVPSGATFTSAPCALSVTFAAGGVGNGVFSGNGCESVKVVMEYTAPSVASQFTLSFTFTDSNGVTCSSSQVINVTPSVQTSLPPVSEESPCPPPPTPVVNTASPPPKEYPVSSPPPAVSASSPPPKEYPVSSPPPKAYPVSSPPPAVSASSPPPKAYPVSSPPAVSNNSPPPSDHMTCYPSTVTVIKAEVTFHGVVAYVHAAPGTKITTCGISGIPKGATLHSQAGDMEVSYGYGGTATGVFSGSGCDTATIMMDWTPSAADIGVTITIEIFFLDNHQNDCTVTTPMECGNGPVYPAPTTSGGSPPQVSSPPPVVASPPPKVASPPPVVASPPPKVYSPPPYVAASPPPKVASPPPTPATSGGGGAYPSCPVVTLPSGGWNPSHTVFTSSVTVTATAGSTLSSCHISGLPEGGVITSSQLVITYNHDGTATGVFSGGCTYAVVVFSYEPTPAAAGTQIKVTMSFTDSNHGTASASMWCQVGSAGRKMLMA